MDTFLKRQMDWFNGTRPASQPPLVQTFGWNTTLPFPPTELDPPPVVTPPGPKAPSWDMAYRGDIYDQSLAAIWFTERGRLDALYGRNPTANLSRARQLLDAGIFLGEHDPKADGRLRMAYYANNLLSPDGTQSSILAPDASTGNISYFGIALTRFYDVAQRSGYLDATTRRHYLDVAEQKAQWIVQNCTDSRPYGFTGGYVGGDQTPVSWKSTEHNIDAWVFAQNLYSLTGDRDWKLMAERAGRLVQNMYVNVDPWRAYYVTGTLDDGITRNPSPVPADAQAWTALARWGGTRIDSDLKARKAMRWLEENLRDDSETVRLPEDGVKFSNVGKNMQSEVTASAAFAERWLGRDLREAKDMLGLLDWVRDQAAPDFDGIIPNGLGLVATPGLEGAWTGYGPDAWYYKLTHVASSSWAGLAYLHSYQGDVWANPLQPLPLRPQLWHLRSSSVSVPEPSALALLVCGLFTAWLCRRLRRSR